MVRKVREAVPDHVIVQAFTAVEIEHMANIAEKSTLEVLEDLKEAGLDALPGGGAEIFSERTRAAAWDKKTRSRRLAAHPRRGALPGHHRRTARCSTATSRRPRSASTT